MQVWDNPVLGMWVHRLRRDFKNDLLPQWQVDKLDTLQFAWKVDQISAKWHHNFHEARRYKVSLVKCDSAALWTPAHTANVHRSQVRFELVTADE